VLGEEKEVRFLAWPNLLAWLIAKTVFDPELVKGFLTCHGVLLLRWARALVAAGVSVSLAGVLVACFDEG
jgi:hypothetical protein